MKEARQIPPRAWLAMAAIATVCGAFWLGAAHYFDHGMLGRYFTLVNGERTLVVEHFEHRIRIPNVHRPMSRYIQGWPFERLELPTELPAIDVEFEADLACPQSGRELYVASPDRIAIEIDGEEVDGVRSEPLSEGVHRVQIRWQARAPVHPPRPPYRDDAHHLRLLWGSGNHLSEIPRSALTPPSEVADGTRPAYLALFAFIGIGLSALAFFAGYEKEPRRRRKRVALFAAALLFVCALGARSFDYDVMPEFRENADELFATWNGYSLLTDGTPRGWSLWPHVYPSNVERETVHFFGEERIVISPYFEHPPLLHLLVGAVGHISGAQHWLQIKLAHTRWVPILLSSLSALLLFAIGRRLWPRSAGAFIGTLLYAMMPIVALQARVIKEEALLVPLLLAMLFFFLRWRDDGHRLRDLLLASLFAGLAPFTKVPAVVFVPALVMLVAAERGQTKRAFIAAFTGIGLALLWPLFGALIDWDTFVLTQVHQGGRPTHWNIFVRFFETTLINHRIIGRGWILFLWIAAFATFGQMSRRNAAVLAVPLATYFAAITIGAGNWTFGWYLLPLYPLLCLAAGEFIAGLYRRPTLVGGLLFVVLLVYYTLNFSVDPHWAKQPPAWPQLRRLVTLTTAAALTPYALVQVWNRNEHLLRWARITTVVGMLTFTVMSARFIVNYDEIYETYSGFDRDGYFYR